MATLEQSPQPGKDSSGSPEAAAPPGPGAAGSSSSPSPAASSASPEDGGCSRAFTWDDYLQNTGAVAADSDAFRHVEAAHASLCKPGQLFGLPWQQDAYWLARIVTVSGPLLAVEFVEAKPRSQTVWFNVASRTGKSLLWCRQNPQFMKPPPDSCVGDDPLADLWRSLDNATPAPSEMLDGDAMQLAERILEGGLMECADSMSPYALWFVQVVSNNGGRLQLRWMDEKCAASIGAAFHLFFTSYRLHPVGFGTEEKFFYSPSLSSEARVSSEAAAQLASPWKPALAAKFMRPFRLPPQHKFRVGHRLEAVHPWHRRTIQPATVVSVIDQHFFVIKLDDLRPPAERSSVARLCTADTCEIMAANTCASRALPLTPPPGHSGHFSWPSYIVSFPSASDGHSPQAPPDSSFQLPDEEFDFCLGEKLEMVSQDDDSVLVPATISRFVGRLMLLHLNHLPPLSPPVLVDMGSTSLFHVGWAELNGHKLLPPFCYQQAAQHRRLLAVSPPSWCSKIYVNGRCHVGPSLSKSAVDSLPRSLGPADVCVVLEDLLGRIVQAAYNPTKVLKDIERDPEEPRDSLTQRPMKAKFKGKSYASVVQLCNNSMFLDEYLKQFCIRLKACPYFVSVFRLRASCPEICPARLKKLSSIERLSRRSRAPRLLRPNPSSAGELPQLDPEEDSCHGDEDELASNHSSGGVRVQTRGVRLPSYASLEKRKRRSDQPGGKKAKLSPPLISNPLHWTVEDLLVYLKSNADISDDICELLVSEKVDGQAFLLLTLPTAETALGLTMNSAVKLCNCVWQLKRAFFQQFTDCPP